MPTARIGFVAGIWGGARRAFGGGGPSLQTGLSLQRCNGKKKPPKAPTEAARNPRRSPSRRKPDPAVEAAEEAARKALEERSRSSRRSSASPL